MQQTLADLIRDTVKHTSLEIEFRESYSGRGMYGRKCIGITGTKNQCQKLIAEVISQMHYSDADTVDDFDEWCDELMSFEFDSMGRDVIMYWTGIPTTDLSEEEKTEANSLRDENGN